MYKRHRFPAEIISHCVWLYFRFCLSYRDVEELMAERGVTLTYEAVRYWCRKFGQAYAHQLRRPCQLAGFGEAGLTCRVISPVVPLALWRIALDRSRHPLSYILCCSGADTILLVVHEERPRNPGVLVG
jgi:hypothetical protein